MLSKAYDLENILENLTFLILQIDFWIIITLNFDNLRFTDWAESLKV